MAEIRAARRNEPVAVPFKERRSLDLTAVFDTVLQADNFFHIALPFSVPCAVHDKINTGRHRFRYEVS
ncbi:hypothetical protein ACX8Z7_12320 [Glutamicibacter endophyticus]